MTDADQRAKAEALRGFHLRNEIFVLPCAWDVASARIFEEAGFEAVGTTSAGVAASLGRADGERMDFAEYLEIVRRIAGGVRVPVTVDVEAGFAATPEGAAKNAELVLGAGAVGINVEDEDHARISGAPLQPLALAVRKIEAIRTASRAYGVPLVINAKTDVMWLSAGGGPEEIFAETVRRANAYGAAGADCVFVPGNIDRETIARLVAAIRYPLNVVVKDGTPPVRELQALGVRRVSLGSGPMRGTMGLTRRIAREVLDEGTYESFLEPAIPYGEVRSMFES